MLTGVPKPKRKATNLALDQALIAEAKELEINVPTVAEVGLSKAIAARRAELWLEENREAIDENNRYFSEHGLPFAELRKY
jgi:antitoxin CcdA